MNRPSFATDRSSARARLRASGVLATMALATAVAVCAAPSAVAQTHGSRAHAQVVVTHAHKGRAESHGARVGARAHKAACAAAAHAKHDSHGCSSAKGHKHRTKTEAHHKHATGSRHTPVQDKAQTPPSPAPAGSPGTTCSDGVNATLDEEGTFACAGGGEPGCQEGFAPVVAGDGSTLVCEPEQVEAGGEAEG